MSGRERVLTIRLLEKTAKNRDYAKSLGIEVTVSTAVKKGPAGSIL